jgi:hypothetical protein
MAGSIDVSPGISLTPSSTQQTLATNYITDFDYVTQYLPETDKDEFSRYGNRTINGFLRNVGTAEIPFASDLIKWSESGRLHTKYTACSIAYGGGNDTAVLTVADAGIGACNFRVGQVVFLSSNVANLSDKAIVTAVSGLTFTVAYYAAAGGTIVDNAANDITAFVYGSEFQKGTAGMSGGLTPVPDIFDVKPVIIKDRYEISGSDMAQIGWIEASSEEGNGGFLWYIKAAAETRLRYDDQLEMMSVEHVDAGAASGALAYLSPSSSNIPGETAAASSAAGSQGLFAAIEDRGNIWSGGNPATMADFDTIIERLDGQGSIAENTLFINRQFSLDLDDMLAAQNSYGVGGTSYGMFNNDADMALNLGFTGFRRGSYDFYKTDWKYLNDVTLRGGLVGGKVNGVLVPAGTTTVYDQVLGANAKRPFLHVRYRMINQENRKLKSWITGSAGGASNSDVDAMYVNYLSERALCTLGANNFFKFED